MRRFRATMVCRGGAWRWRGLLLWALVATVGPGWAGPVRLADVTVGEGWVGRDRAFAAGRVEMERGRLRGQVSGLWRQEPEAIGRGGLVGGHVALLQGRVGAVRVGWQGTGFRWDDTKRWNWATGPLIGGDAAGRLGGVWGWRVVGRIAGYVNGASIEWAVLGERWRWGPARVGIGVGGLANVLWEGGLAAEVRPGLVGGVRW